MASRSTVTRGKSAGYRATSQWAYADLLPRVGAVHEKARVVRDRDRIAWVTLETMTTLELPATDPLFGALERLERLVLARGARKTFCAMYCDNPWVETERFEVYLLPEPGGPHHHPQWNLRCDPEVGRFRRVSIRRRDPVRGGGWSNVDFSSGRIVIEPPLDTGDAWQPVREAVDEALRVLDATTM